MEKGLPGGGGGRWEIEWVCRFRDWEGRGDSEGKGDEYWFVFCKWGKSTGFFCKKKFKCFFFSPSFLKGVAYYGFTGQLCGIFHPHPDLPPPQKQVPKTKGFRLRTAINSLVSFSGRSNIGRIMPRAL